MNILSCYRSCTKTGKTAPGGRPRDNSGCVGRGGSTWLSLVNQKGKKALWIILEERGGSARMRPCVLEGKFYLIRPDVLYRKGRGGSARMRPGVWKGWCMALLYMACCGFRGGAVLPDKAGCMMMMFSLSTPAYPLGMLWRLQKDSPVAFTGWNIYYCTNECWLSGGSNLRLICPGSIPFSNRLFQFSCTGYTNIPRYLGYETGQSTPYS